MKMNADLGQKGPCCTAEVPMKEETYYPSLHIESEESLGLPKEGTMTVRYCLTHESTSTARGGKSHYSCSLDIKKILEVEGEKEEEDEYKEKAPARGEISDAGRALDAIIAAMKD